MSDSFVNQPFLAEVVNLEDREDAGRFPARGGHSFPRVVHAGRDLKSHYLFMGKSLTRERLFAIIRGQISDEIDDFSSMCLRAYGAYELSCFLVPHVYADTVSPGNISGLCSFSEFPPVRRCNSFLSFAEDWLGVGSILLDENFSVPRKYVPFTSDLSFRIFGGKEKFADSVTFLDGYYDRDPFLMGCVFFGKRYLEVAAARHSFMLGLGSEDYKTRICSFDVMKTIDNTLVLQYLGVFGQERVDVVHALIGYALLACSRDDRMAMAYEVSSYFVESFRLLRSYQYSYVFAGFDSSVPELKSDDAFVLCLREHRHSFEYLGALILSFCVPWLALHNGVSMRGVISQDYNTIHAAYSRVYMSSVERDDSESHLSTLVLLALHSQLPSSKPMVLVEEAIQV
jgi:hypothetical protein